MRDLLDGHLPYLPELPGRGPGADLVGRAAGLLVDLAVDLQPSGWRLADRPGRDARRTAGLLREDLDELAEAFEGYGGPLKVQVAGPWTLATAVSLPRGERALADPGACRDLVASLAEGVRAHIAEVRRLVPEAQLVLQLDEPSLPAVLDGRLPTASGYGRLPAPDPQDAVAALATVLAAGPTDTVLHCCAAEPPLALLRDARPGALSLDTTLLGPRGWEGVAVAVEDGIRLFAGAVPTDGSLARAQDVADRVTDPWHRVGMPPAGLGDLVVTPSCGLAGRSPEEARRLQRLAVDAAAELDERSTR